MKLAVAKVRQPNEKVAASSRLPTTGWIVRLLGVGIAVVLAALGVVADAAVPGSLLSDCNPTDDQVAFYGDTQFNGPCVVKGPGEYPNADAMGLPSDTMSSLKVGTRAMVRLYRDENYGGIYEDFWAEDSDIGDNAIGSDTVTSARVYRRGAACQPNDYQVAFFGDANYDGQCSVKGVGDYPDENAIGIFNDSMTSVKLGANVKVTLYADSNFGGISQEFTSSVATLVGTSIGNDQVTSARVTTGTPPTPTPTPVPQIPDLQPFTPPGYTYPVVPSSVTGTHAPNTLYAGRPTYFDWHFTNAGPGPANGTFRVEVSVDGAQVVGSDLLEVLWIAPGQVGGYDDAIQTISPPGWHTVRMVVDSTNAIAESNETNNTWQRAFCWEAPPVTPVPTTALPPLPHRVLLPLGQLPLNYCGGAITTGD